MLWGRRGRERHGALLHKRPGVTSQHVPDRAQGKLERQGCGVALKGARWRRSSCQRPSSSRARQSLEN
jgi:hypothetical protein